MITSWNTVVNKIALQPGEVRTIGKDFYKNIDGRFNKIAQMWNNAGYTQQKVEWINYYPDIHFSNDIVEEFAKAHNLTTARAWISKVRPGKSAPWHQDIDDDLEKYESLGKLKRYTCQICQPEHGQVFLIEQESYYMLPQNTTVLWNDYMAWHGASNCGFKDHYLFHFIGY